VIVLGILHRLLAFLKIWGWFNLPCLLLREGYYALSTQFLLLRMACVVLDFRVVKIIIRMMKSFYVA
jgi:hypothetical protein